MAVFESIRVFEGVPLFWEEHLHRLRRACDDREFPVAPGIFAAAADTLREDGEDGFVRIYITAGDGSVTDPVTSPRIFLIREDRERPSASSYKLAMPEEPHQPIFGGLKTANYWPNIDTLQRALKRGDQEALLFNEHAELVSACMANVFLVTGGVIRTPALPCGARDGVIREWIIKQTTVQECSLFLDDVRNADEVFITNSWLGIMPVTEIDSRTLPSREQGTRLQTALERAIRAQVGA
jgi:branched-subunit amino acid aminotransferase/4-amino-4-deoxychorismate lyase